MPRYEFRDDKSNKFWEITRAGLDVTTRWGKIGTDGQSKTKSYGGEAEAEKEYDKLIKSKTKKGYILVESDNGAPAAAVETGGDAANPELEAVIRGAPDDPDGYLVYGDWLASHGSKLGELVSIQSQLADDRGNDDLRAAERKIFEDHRDQFFGPPHALADKDRPAYGEIPRWRRRKSWAEDGWNYGHSYTQWRYGFIRNLTFDTGYYGEEEKFGEDAAAILEGMLALPPARFVQEFALGEIWMDDWEGPDSSYAVNVVAKAPCRESLRVFDVLGGDHDLSGVQLDASALWRGCPNLEVVELYAGQLTVGEIHMPRGRRFAAQTGGLAAEDLEQITKAHWPELEDLEIWFGADEYGASCDAAGLEPIFAGKGLSKLKQLALNNSEFGDDICAGLVKAPVVAQLETLSLTMGCIGDQGARQLIDNAAKFSHLKRLAIAGYFSDDTVEALKKVAAEVSVDVRGSADEDYRYVEVGE